MDIQTKAGAEVRELLAVLDFWTVAQTTALVSAVFGVFTVTRACWDNTGLPALQDRYLELVSARAAELRSGVPAGRQNAAAYARRAARSVADPRLILRGTDGGWLRRVEQARRSRPDAVQRRLAADSLASLLRRPELVPEQEALIRNAVAELEPAVRNAQTLDELSTVRPLRTKAAGALLRGPAVRRFLSVFLPAMGRYLDFVGRGSALGLAVGVLLSGGLTAQSTLVGMLTTVCGVGGGIIFTITVIRCDARSWPARTGRLRPVLRGGYPEASFLLRLTLTVAAILLAVSILRR
ncbi:hypothetical protein H9639_15060 [Arthrobacter sp. Sa2CUA1]|uniref:Uncharacterized protein n=1 Tax=Arthrobacter gallicola TaxID=2762225 RepID=A0ABR8UWX8_9MICC|nr:hypothetical protein [Arthrobacter gallicola]MBD7996616.1 hypothetical protein [Arthrobacter gallicola]